MSSTASRLRSDWNSLTQRLSDLVRELPIRQRSEDRPGVFIVAPDYGWGEPSAEQSNVQLSIKRDYDEWFEILHSVFAKAPNDLSRKLKKADQRLRMWIELRPNWLLQANSASNEVHLRDDAKHFMELLAIIEAGRPVPPILIPDTNAIIASPDPTEYRTLVDNDSFIFLMLPTVLAELDTLKNSHQNPAFRTKVNKVITRIKGWRNQGTLRDGVTVDRTITVKAIASEPNMQNALTWLDKDNRDDRIIASVLEASSLSKRADGSRNWRHKPVKQGGCSADRHR